MFSFSEILLAGLIFFSLGWSFVVSAASSSGASENDADLPEISKFTVRELKDSLFISMPIKYIISGPALGPKPFFNMDWSINTGYVILSCYYSLPSNWLVHSFRDEQYREGDCVIVQGSLEKNALFLGRLYD